jgi:hypothetical protein
MASVGVLQQLFLCWTKLLYTFGRQPVLLAFCPQVAYNLQCEHGVCLQCASLKMFLMIALGGEVLG